MTTHEATPEPRIHLDLGDPEPGRAAPSRRSRLAVQEPSPPLPRIGSTLGKDDIGSDEAERTVGLLFLASALPGVLSLILGKGASGLLGILVPLYFGVGLIRRDDFVRQWVVAACLVQLVLSPLSALAFPASMLSVLGGIVQNVGLLVLVSGRALSRRTYLVSVAAAALGTLSSVVGVFLH